METPGLNHIIMTIKDVKTSQRFYGDLLGFEIEPIADGFFLLTGGVAIFFFPSHHPIPDDRFNEFRIGLDHLSFTAPNESALHSLAEQLQASGVETKGVETYHTGNKYVAFRDPDNIQLEYWLPRQ
jgi:catechol 2,3-dioxygenase-like lactoylglutathione lyase family enzyme